MRPSAPFLAATIALMLVAPGTAGADPGASPAVSPAAPVPCAGVSCWYPDVGNRWQYQLQAVSGFASTGGIDVGISSTPFTGGAPVHPQVFDIDLFVDTSVSGNNTTLNTAAVNAIHAMRARAICYVDAGSWENWRADADQFPSAILGKTNGWPGERWLDIRQTSTLLPLMDARLQKCVQAGFDGVEWDNVEGYANKTNFPLTASDQIAYDTSLANLAHQRGLTVALKNDVGQLSSLAPYFDYAVNEQCQQYRECGAYTATFIGIGKALFQVEYKLKPNKFCAKANAANRNTIKKSLNLYAGPWIPCR